MIHYALGLWDWITGHATVISAVISMLAAVAVARYTAKLNSATREQARLTNEALEVTRNEFAATHRPQLEVRFVREVTSGVEITVINTGTSEARFVSARAEIRHILEGNRFPSPRDIVPQSSFSLRSIFRPSESDTYVIPPGTNAGQAFEDGFGGPLHVFGWIVYDTVGNQPMRRTTYFGRKVELLQPELVPVEGSDWNFLQ